jgi:preprotein translocase subunit SecB
MTMQTPLKASPLMIEHHEFLSIHVDASEKESPQGPIALKTSRRLELHPENPRRWKVELVVGFGSGDAIDETPYSGSISVAGWFSVSERYPVERQQALIEVTAVSILYGACREMVASFTARSRHGMLSLPSVTFPPISTDPSIPATEVSPAVKKPRRVVRKSNP